MLELYPRHPNLALSQNNYYLSADGTAGICRARFVRHIAGGKTQSPDVITDEQPGSAIVTPAAPGRPRELIFKATGTARGISRHAPSGTKPTSADACCISSPITNCSPRN